MSRFLLLTVLIGLGSAYAQYSANWTSLDKRPIPQWYSDAKFGIFIHWGVYSVPAWGRVGDYAEWYWNYLNIQGSPTQVFHDRVYGQDFQYQDFAPMFKAELFNATAWADIFRRSGAQYVVPTSKHHEGFTNWPSAQSWNWNSVDVGPHQDLIGEIMTAVRGAGLHAGLYFSLYEWYNPIYRGSNPSDYVNQIMYPQWMDLIDNYKPDLLWCDGDWEQNSTFWQSQEFLAYVYNDSPVKDQIVVNDRFGSDCSRTHGGFYTPEYSGAIYLDHKWEVCYGIDVHSFGLNRNTPADLYSTSETLINILVRTVANNGNLLLDIGPRSDGTIPTIMQERLLDIGAWLDVNGEGIYGSVIWRIQQEGGIDNTTTRYTSSKDGKTIYAFILQYPDDYLVTLPSPIATGASTISMLGVSGQLKFASSKVGVTVSLPILTPANSPCQYIWTLKLTGFQ